MTAQSDLVQQLVALCRVLVDMPHALVEAAVDEASDRLSNRSADDDHALESLLDGIRWGHRAAWSVEREGGVILRLLAPRGVAFSHEWLGGLGDLSDAQIATLLQLLEAEISALRATR